MKKKISNQEILLMQNSSFFKQDWCEKATNARTKKLSQKDLVIQLCWDGVLPELLQSPFEVSILKRAIEKGLVEIHMHNLRDFSTNAYKQIDDYQFGGGAGMVMMIEPIDKCITKLKSHFGRCRITNFM